MAKDLPVLARDVPPDGAGERLDRLLALWYEGVSRARVQDWIRAGCVRVGGEPATRPSQSVDAGVRIEVTPPAALEPKRREGAALDVLFQDEHILAIDKPAGLIVHPREGGGRGDSLAEVAELHYGPLPPISGAERPGIVHRLDMDTSGVIVLARTDVAARSLVDQFQARTVEKVYHAFVQGDPRFDSEWIEAPIERHPRSHERMHIAEEGEGREAETYYEVRERFGHTTLLECRPSTGRTHQIRVHLEHVGLPILGDRLYTGGRTRRPSRAGRPTIGRQALHALTLRFDHPATLERTQLEAPLAADLEALLAALRAGSAG